MYIHWGHKWVLFAYFEPFGESPPVLPRGISVAVDIDRQLLRHGSLHLVLVPGLALPERVEGEVLRGAGDLVSIRRGLSRS